MHKIIPPVRKRSASLWSIIPWGVESIKSEDFIDVFTTRNACNEIVCFLEGVETRRRVLKNVVFLKNKVLI